MKLQLIKDVNNNDYIGLNIPSIQVLNKPILTLINNIGYKKTIDCLNNVVIRNGGYYFHCTVFNVMEFGMIKKQLENNFFQDDIINDIDYNLIFDGIGLGTNDKGDETYFIVCHCKELNDLRIKYNLEPKDLHITIGFTNKDIFNIDKSIVKWQL